MALDRKPLDAKAQAAIALHRSGFGPRAGSVAAIGTDARGAILAELDRPNAGQITDDDLLSSGEAARSAFNFRQERKAERLAQRAEREMAQADAAKAAEAAKAEASANSSAAHIPAMSPPASAASSPAADAQNKRDPGPGIPQQIFLEEAKARFDSALGADIGFAERLVWFWRTIFASRPTRSAPSPALSNARRSARTFSATSPTC